jgi:hypothetical protein
MVATWVTYSLDFAQVEVRGVARQNDDAAGRIRLHFVPVEPIAEADVENARNGFQSISSGRIVWKTASPRWFRDIDVLLSGSFVGPSAQFGAKYESRAENFSDWAILSASSAIRTGAPVEVRHFGAQHQS